MCTFDCLNLVFDSTNPINNTTNTKQHNSGIACHSDECYESGATIYLNDWNMNFGGLFVWKDDNSDIMKAIVPQKNMMVLNDEKQNHIVTSVSSLSKGYRLTIQIWTKKK